MRPAESMRSQLRGLDGKDYGACQVLCGSYSYETFELHIDRIPKDPYAPPHTGIYRARVNWTASGLSDDTVGTATRRIALCDYLTRQFHSLSATVSRRRGTGNSGLITIARPGQEILERTSVVVTDEFVEARFFVGLPARNRRVRADVAETMLFDEVPRIVNGSLFASALDARALAQHLQTAEDAEFLRDRLPSLGLIAFVANGSLLPRASGVDPRPLDSATVVPFRSPESLRVEVELPNAGIVSGMGVPTGVTLLVGGGYHGKSTVLKALEDGVYNHVPGDGRERCVASADTVKIRAYSGRNVSTVDISAFIENIPTQEDTVGFSSVNASGSTSQAAFTSEALEVGARVLLMDEDTCATNFLIRDQRMQQLVTKEHEPITAFIDTVRLLFERHGISTVLVLGGSGDYLSVADLVIQLINYVPRDVTGTAKAIVERHPSGRIHEGREEIALPRPRYPMRDGVNSRTAQGRRRVFARHPRELVYGRLQVDLSDIEQLHDSAQTKAIGLAIERLCEQTDGKTTLREMVDRIESELREHGLDMIDPNRTGDLAAFRRFELAATLNRMRGLRVSQTSSTNETDP